MNHKLSFYKLENIDDNKSENTPKYQKIFELFGQANQLTTNKIQYIESINYGNIIDMNYHIFLVRFDSRINKDLYISFNKNMFQIKQIINQNYRNRFLKIITMII